MFGLPLATIITIIPFIGMLFVAITDEKNILGVKSVSLWTTSFALCFSLIVAGAFDYSAKTITEEIAMFNKSLVGYRVGIDAFSAMFVPVICFVCFACVLWITRNKTNKIFYISILLFETLATGAFYAWDLFLLFVFIEASTIPLFVLMSQQKEHSTDVILYFVMYTMLSAILVLTAFILIYLETHTTNIKEVHEIGVKNTWAFWLLAVGISIKMPIFPFYSWLPIAHVKSQTICSVLLASIVLKFSSLLIVRFIQPLFMGTLQEHTQIVVFVIILSIGFATCQLLFQKDIKSVFAHFSIIHLNSTFMILLGEMRCNGFTFAVMGHSLLMPILFFTSSLIEKVYTTRQIEQIKAANNVSKSVKVIALGAFFCLISAPFTWGFVSEILTFQAVSKMSVIWSLCLGGFFLVSATFGMHLYNSTFAFWKCDDGEVYSLDTQKKFALLALYAITLLVGIFPKIVLL